MIAEIVERRSCVQVLKLIGEARGNGVLLRPFRPGNIAMKVVGGEFSVVRVGAKETTQWSFLPCQSADVLEQQWYTHPGGEVVSTQQCDSYGLGVLLYEVCELLLYALEYFSWR